MPRLHAQVNMTIGSGAHFKVNGTAQVVMGSGNFQNNGNYSDNSGIFVAGGGITFSGTGNTNFRKFIVDNAGVSNVNSLVSVYDTTVVVAGVLTSNGNLHMRSDLNADARTGVYDRLTNDIQGLQVIASTTSGMCPSYNTDMKLNMYGPVLTYQWQKSADNTTWTNIAGATNATRFESVTATAYYRCRIRTTNTAYDQSTPSVLMTMIGTPPVAGTISGPTSVVNGFTIPLTATGTGGTWIAGNSNAIVYPTGIVKGMALGTVEISYSVTNACGTAVATHVVTVEPAPTPITGTLNVCEGAATTLANATPGGTWSSSNPAIATVDPASGVVTGLVTGTTDISYTVAGISSVATFFVDPLPVAGTISGNTSVCEGRTTMLFSTGVGGVWSSSLPSRGTISSIGIVTGISTGSLNIAYTVTNGCGVAVANWPMFVNPTPAPITGVAPVCPGSFINLTTTPSGGVWSSSDPTVSVNASNGRVTGITAGTALIIYQTTAGCKVTTTVTVLAPPPAIGGILTVCPGATTTLTNTSTGGTWSSSSVARATIGTASGIATGVSSGTTVITYFSSAGCQATAVLTVLPAPAVITGALTICTGTTSDLNCTTTAGVWTSSNPAIATVNATNGIVASVAGTGTSAITYTVGSLCPRIVTVTIAAQSPIAGNGVICTGQPVAVATLTNATPGGTWTSSNTARVTIAGATGMMNGLTTGTATISYTLNAGCTSTTVVTVNAAVATLAGTYTVCPGVTSALTNTTPGGTWTSSNTSFAIVGSMSGIATGIAQGVSTITYQVTPGCYKTRGMGVLAAPVAISGPDQICQGSTGIMASGPAGGAWSSSNTTNATVAVVSGNPRVTGLATGTATISYTISNGCAATKVVTVTASVAPITGTTALCAGATGTLANADAGGAWSSSNTAKATVDAVTGSVSGIASGTSVITYMLAPGCYRTNVQTVNTTPSAIAGTGVVCEGSVMTFTSGPTGGAWTSSNTAIATVSTTGIVRGIAGGQANITYQYGTGCYAERVVTVNSMPSIPTGVLTVCTGNTTTLTGLPAGGTWSSSNLVKATVDVNTGVVTGLTTGNSNISYTLSTGCLRKVAVTVNLSPAAISGPSTVTAPATIALTCSPTGTWSSSNTSVATVNVGNGITRGISAGDATITFQLSNGCRSTKLVTVTVLRPENEPVTEVTEKPTVSIFPNPSSGMLKVASTVAGKFILFTLDGKMIEQYPIETGTTSVTLPYNLAAGMYMGHFVGEDGTNTVIRLVYMP